MRTRAARWTFLLVAWIALGGAAFFIFHAQQRILADAAALRNADQRAREASDALDDLRAGQQAYVAAGQGVAFWMPKVSATVQDVTTALTELGQSASSAGARQALDEATASLSEFSDIDKRARDYVNASQTLMAGDVIFTEGTQAAMTTRQHVEAVREAERVAFDANEADLRKQQATAGGAAAGLVALIMLLLVPGGPENRSHRSQQSNEDSPSALPSETEAPGASLVDGIVSHARPAPSQPRPTPPEIPAFAPQPRAPVLKAAADLSTEFGRVRDARELIGLLGRTAEMMDAAGLIVWIGDLAGSDLRPVLTHGYAPQVLARLAAVPRSADNAAAAAYRSGKLQVVQSHPGGSNGAVVAPILTADGCTGAVSAEIKGGGEDSEATQALATIVASHLASVLTTAPAEAAPNSASPSQRAQRR